MVRTTGAEIERRHGGQRNRGLGSTVCAMVGVRLPMTTHVLQAFVTEPLRPLLEWSSSPRSCAST